jgi:hypothetical protein
MPRTTLLTGALLAAGAVAFAAASSPANDDERRGGKRVHVLHVERQGVVDRFLDLDDSATPSHPAPDSVGDQYVFAGDFYAGARKVGTDVGSCQLAREPLIFHCAATNSFAEGDLTVQFMADWTQTAPGRFAITGGTRNYRGASGEVTFVDNPDPQRDDVTFRFTTG